MHSDHHTVHISLEKIINDRRWLFLKRILKIDEAMSSRVTSYMSVLLVYDLVAITIDKSHLVKIA